jgi:hypothetical protein
MYWKEMASEWINKRSLRRNNNKEGEKRFDLI